MNKLTVVFTFFTFHLLFQLLPAQASSLLYSGSIDNIKQEMERRNLRSSGDWDRIQELMFLRDNFSTEASYYDEQIAEIYAHYRFDSYRKETGADRIMNQQKENAMRQMGNTPPPTNEETADAYYMEKQAQLKAQKTRELLEDITPNYSRSGSVALTPSEDLLATRKKFKLADESSPAFRDNVKHFALAAQEIYDMLNNKTPLSIKRAVFVTENAWYGNTKEYASFCKDIDQLVWMCKENMKQKNLSLTSEADCHKAIQQLFSDTLTFTTGKGKSKIIFPFHYDFNDCTGEVEHSNLFVSKLLRTHSGQCHSMPLLYLILAEELNVQAYITMAPMHSYIKYRINKNWYAFETTTGKEITDDWIVSSGYISSEAIKNRLYLFPQSKRETIAECLIDLTLNFEQKLGFHNFVLECANNVLRSHPSCLRAIMSTHNTILAYCFQKADESHFPVYEEYENYPELNKLFTAMVDLEVNMSNLGYLKISQEDYQKWLNPKEEFTESNK